MSKGAKITLWVIIALVVVSVLGAVFLKYVKPKMDEKRELKRLAVTDILTSAQRDVNTSAGAEKVAAIIEEKEPTVLGVGGLPIIK